MAVPYTLIRTDRRSYALQIEADGSLILRVPLRTSAAQVKEILLQKQQWILKKHLEAQKRQSALPFPALTEAQRKELQKKYRKAAASYFPERVRYYQQFTGGSYSRISIRDQKTRWGSCSSKGTLSFNWRLMLAPKEVLDYVVVHELCHLTHMDHSKAFWAQVAAVMPDYAIHRRWLKEQGDTLMQY